MAKEFFEATDIVTGPFSTQSVILYGEGMDRLRSVGAACDVGRPPDDDEKSLIMLDEKKLPLSPCGCSETVQSGVPIRSARQSEYIRDKPGLWAS